MTKTVNSWDHYLALKGVIRHSYYEGFGISEYATFHYNSATGFYYVDKEAYRTTNGTKYTGFWQIPQREGGYTYDFWADCNAQLRYGVRYIESRPMGRVSFLETVEFNDHFPKSNPAIVTDGFQMWITAGIGSEPFNPLKIVVAYEQPRDSSIGFIIYPTDIATATITLGGCGGKEIGGSGNIADTSNLIAPLTIILLLAGLVVISRFCALLPLFFDIHDDKQINTVSVGVPAD